MGSEIDQSDPAVFHILKPLFVVGIVGGVVVEHIFADHYKLVNAFLDEDFEYLAFELHDVVVQRIVPFSHHFDDGESLLVVGE